MDYGMVQFPSEDSLYRCRCMPTTMLELTHAAAQALAVSAPQERLDMEKMISNLVISFQPMGSNRVRNSTLYVQDYFAWTHDTAALLRAGTWHDIDVHTLAEEIESMGASQYDAVSSAVYQTLVHLLKWRYQPEHQSKSWHTSVVEHRNRIARKLRRSPSLEHKIPLMIMEEYPGACRKANAQTGLPLSTFPPRCPWTEGQVRSDDFWPE